MLLPRIWGQGQLFAYSALDGDSFSSDDLAGYLSGDHIGVIFCLGTKRELLFGRISDSDTEFAAVTSDYINYGFPISASGCEGENVRSGCKLIFARRNILIGETAGSVCPLVFVEGAFQGSHEELTIGEASGQGSSLSLDIQCTDHDEYTALAVCGEKFVFAYGHSHDEIIRLVMEGFSLNIAEEENRKLSYYRQFGAAAEKGLRDSASYARLYPGLYAKCLSVMKTQLYSPEGEYTMIRSTPDRLPHKKLWLWDSIFHGIGFRHMDTALARDLIRAIFVHQNEDGFIPHMADLDLESGITQPPIIAWGALKVCEKALSAEETDKDTIDFLKEVYENNKRFLSWYHMNRRLDAGTYLYTWNMTDDVNCRCDESGMDNSPRFDGHDPLYAIDLSCFMANDVRVMAQIAHILGLSEDERFYSNWYDRISLDVNRILWSEEDGFYFDLNTKRQEFSKVWSVASFLPIFAGVCSQKQCEALLSHLTDPTEFGTVFPIPSISLKDPTYGSDMWRGPVWINFNYMIIDGLRHYSDLLSHTYTGLADELIRKTLAFINKWYRNTGCVFEFYDSSDQDLPYKLNRKGLPFEPYNFDVRYQTIHDFGWSVTLAFDLLN